MKSYTKEEFLKYVGKQAKKHAWMNKGDDVGFLFLDTGSGLKILSSSQVYGADIDDNGMVKFISIHELVDNIKKQRVITEGGVNE